ncbi:MAG: hypothetical protein LBH48_02275 [Bifidobacteriaceae bacterium]|nr:hypothetical protein [Bifidobacteriaceae bacterium]
MVCAIVLSIAAPVMLVLALTTRTPPAEEEEPEPSVVEDDQHDQDLAALVVSSYQMRRAVNDELMAAMQRSFQEGPEANREPLDLATADLAAKIERLGLNEWPRFDPADEADAQLEKLLEDPVERVRLAREELITGTVAGAVLPANFSTLEQALGHLPVVAATMFDDSSLAAATFSYATASVSFAEVCMPYLPPGSKEEHPCEGPLRPLKDQVKDVDEEPASTKPPAEEQSPVLIWWIAFGLAALGAAGAWTAFGLSVRKNRTPKPRPPA